MRISSGLSVLTMPALSEGVEHSRDQVLCSYPRSSHAAAEDGRARDPDTPADSISHVNPSIMQAASIASLFLPRERWQHEVPTPDGLVVIMVHGHPRG